MLLLYFVVTLTNPMAYGWEENDPFSWSIRPNFVPPSPTLKTATTTTRSKREIVFQNYGYPRLHDLPALNRKIFKGYRVTIREHPYVVSIRRQYGHYMPGTLINTNLVLTVAHPLYRVSTLDLAVVCGENYSDRGTSLNSVVFVIIHEEFDPNYLFNDIAILRIAVDIYYTTNVKAIRINFKAPPLGSQAFVTGWGRCDLTGKELCLPRSNIYHPREVHDPMLRTVTYTITNNSYCGEYAKNEVPLKEGMRCMGTSRLEESMTPCIAVPGAPQVVYGRLNGILSWGFGCGYTFDMPLVYVDLSYYHNWIIHNSQVMFKIPARNLTMFIMAAEAYTIQQWYNETNGDLPPPNKDHDLETCDIDFTLAKLKGTVYDLRDFVYNGKYHKQKTQMYTNIKHNFIRAMTLNVSMPTFPFLNTKILEQKDQAMINGGIGSKENDRR